MNDSDSELLRRYAEDRCEASFTELVNRRIGLVFAAALRQVGGNRPLAEEVTQSVFCDLARKASNLWKRENISGWLYTSTRYAAGKRMQSEQRRAIREQKLVVMQETSKEAEGDWEKLQPVIDDAMHELPEGDRDAVLLRYFEGRAFGEVGAKLGVSEDAARMRVDRALEKLRKLLGRKGVVSTSAVLAAMLANPSLTAAPAGLATTVAGAAMGGTVAAGAVLTMLNLMSIKLKMAGLAVIIAGMSVPMVIQHRTNQELQARNAELTGKTEVLASEIEPLKKENARLAAMVAQSSRARERSDEVYKLRDEVTRLRADSRVRSDDSLNPVLKSLGERAAKLKEGVGRMSDKTIPELQFLREKDWLDAVAIVEKLETDDEYRKALRALRDRGKHLAGEKFRGALQKFAEANDGMMPASLEALQPYFDAPVDPAVIARYQLTQTSGRLAEMGNEHNLIVEIAPAVDEEYDSRFKFGVKGTTSSTYSQISEELQKAAMAYAEANSGRLPRNPTDFSGFLAHPIDSGRVQQFLAGIPPGITTADQLKAQK